MAKANQNARNVEGNKQAAKSKQFVGKSAVKAKKNISQNRAFFAEKDS